MMDRTTTGRAIPPLERDGLIRVEAGDDGRKRAVKLTASGRRRAGEALEAWRQAQEQFELSFGADAAKKLRALMKDVVKAVPGTGAD